MIIPVRCFTCGKLIANKWIEYEALLEDLKHEEDEKIVAEKKREFLDKNRFKRYCCRRMLLSHVDLCTVIKNNQRQKRNPIQFAFSLNELFFLSKLRNFVSLKMIFELTFQRLFKFLNILII